MVKLADRSGDVFSPYFAAPTNGLQQKIVKNGAVESFAEIRTREKYILLSAKLSKEAPADDS